LPESIIKQSENAYGQVGSGRCIALDIGEKRVGVAISDELNISITPLPAIQRTSWKRLLLEVSGIIRHYDAKALVIGLPLKSDNTDGSASAGMRRMAENFRLSLDVPIFLQDEKLTTFQARGNLQEMGYEANEIDARVDSAAAAIILGDFLSSWRQDRDSGPK
jgi:putative Holliday junction resolvase